MILHGDADCHYFSVHIEDEEIAHRLARAHAARCAVCDFEDVRWRFE